MGKLIATVVVMVFTSVTAWCTSAVNYESLLPASQLSEISPQTNLTAELPDVKSEPVIVGRELISSVKIQLQDAPETTNSGIAANIVNGFILKPGETFSYNAVVGERTQDKGYVDGIMPVTGTNGNKENKTTLASGVCRLAVALATTASRAGLELVSIEPHKYTPYYVKLDPSLIDSTVYWPNTDSKFRNNKDYSIQIDCGIDQNFALNANFYKLIYSD